VYPEQEMSPVIKLSQVRYHPRATGHWMTGECLDLPRRNPATTTTRG